MLSLVFFPLLISCTSKNLENSTFENSNDLSNEPTEKKESPTNLLSREINVDFLEAKLEEEIKNRQNQYIIIQKMQSEIQIIQTKIDEIQAYKNIWEDPFSIFNKKIIMNNGTNIYGNIVFQDNNYIKIETFIGILSVPKEDIIRVVDSQGLANANISTIDNDIVELNIISNNNDLAPKENNPNSAYVILTGSFVEEKDQNYNTILSGQVKNIGKKRADFVKINFTIYKDNQTIDNSTEYTVFVTGETRNYDNDIISNSSLSANSTGNFSLIIPGDFGPFTSYTYTIDWEQYN